MLSKERLKIKKLQDESTYNEAISDLLSILNISNPEKKIETKKSISQILAYFGEQVIEIPDGINDLGEQIECILRPSGIMKRHIELVGKWWKDTTGILLASKKDGDIVALFPSNWFGYYYINKSGKKIKINSNNSKEFNIDAFCFYRPFKNSSMKMFDLVKFMIENISIYDFVFLISVYSVVQLLGMSIPYVTNIIYNTLIPSESISLLKTISCTLLGLTIGKTSVRIIQNFTKSQLKGKLNLAIHSAIIMRLFSLPITFFKKYSAGDLSNRIGYTSVLCRTLSETFLSTLLTALFSLGYVFQMIHYAKSMVLVALVTTLFTTCFSMLTTIIFIH